MIRAAMNADLMEGRQPLADEPRHLTALVDAALERFEAGEGRIGESPDPAAALTARYR